MAGEDVAFDSVPSGSVPSERPAPDPVGAGGMRWTAPDPVDAGGMRWPAPDPVAAGGMSWTAPGPAGAGGMRWPTPGPAGAGGRRRAGPRATFVVAVMALAPVMALVAVVALVALLACADALAAPSVPSLKEDKAEAEAQAQELMNEVAGLNDRLRAAGGRYAELQEQLLRAQGRVRDNQTELRETTRALALDRRRLEARVVALYKQPSRSFISVFFQAESFTALVADLEIMKRIGEADADLVDEVEATREELVQRRSRLVNARAAAADLVAEAAAEQAAIESTLAARRQALGTAKAEVTRIARRIEKEKADARRREAARLAAQRGYSGSASVAAAGRYTQETWARELLRRAGLPLTAANVSAVVAWEMAEGGHWFNTAYYNPLNTTQPAPGATPMNSVGVKAYTSWEQGFSATITTLRNGLYGGILAALGAGDDAQAVADAVAASPWGTSYFSVR